MKYQIISLLCIMSYISASQRDIKMNDDSDRYELVHTAVIDTSLNPKFWKAVNAKKLEIVKQLLSGDHIPDVNSQAGGTFSEPAIITAAQGNDIDLLNLLLAADANPDTQTVLNKYTALIVAAKNGFESIVKRLIVAGADVNKRDIRGNTALTWAAENGFTNIIKLLIAKTPVDTKNKYGQTPLMLAAIHGQVGSIELLLSAKADVNLQDDYDCTALFYAAKAGKIKAFKVLLNVGANLDVKDKTGKTISGFIARNPGLRKVLDEFNTVSSDAHRKVLQMVAQKALEPGMAQLGYVELNPEDIAGDVQEFLRPPFKTQEIEEKEKNSNQKAMV